MNVIYKVPSINGIYRRCHRVAPSESTLLHVLWSLVKNSSCLTKGRTPSLKLPISLGC